MKVEPRQAARALSDARRMFRDVPVAHVGSILPDGAPHVVPLWFVWLEETVVLFARRGSQAWRNLVRDPRVALQIGVGRTWNEYAGVVLRGSAAAVDPDSPLAKRALSAWFQKYRGELGGSAFARYAEEVRRPELFEVHPEGIAGWRHAGSAGR